MILLWNVFLKIHIVFPVSPDIVVPEHRDTTARAGRGGVRGGGGAGAARAARSGRAGAGSYCRGYQRGLPRERRTVSERRDCVVCRTELEGPVGDYARVILIVLRFIEDIITTLRCVNLNLSFTF